MSSYWLWFLLSVLISANQRHSFQSTDQSAAICAFTDKEVTTTAAIGQNLFQLNQCIYYSIGSNRCNRQPRFFQYCPESGSSASWSSQNHTIDYIFQGKLRPFTSVKLRQSICLVQFPFFDSAVVVVLFSNGHYDQMLVGQQQKNDPTTMVKAGRALIQRVKRIYFHDNYMFDQSKDKGKSNNNSSGQCSEVGEEEDDEDSKEFEGIKSIAHNNERNELYMIVKGGKGLDTNDNDTVIMVMAPSKRNENKIRKELLYFDETAATEKDSNGTTSGYNRQPIESIIFFNQQLYVLIGSTFYKVEIETKRRRPISNDRGSDESSGGSIYFRIKPNQEYSIKEFFDCLDNGPLVVEGNRLRLGLSNLSSTSFDNLTASTADYNFSYSIYVNILILIIMIMIGTCLTIVICTYLKRSLSRNKRCKNGVEGTFGNDDDDFEDDDDDENSIIIASKSTSRLMEFSELVSLKNSLKEKANNNSTKKSSAKNRRKRETKKNKNKKSRSHPNKFRLYFCKIFSKSQSSSSSSSSEEDEDGSTGTSGNGGFGEKGEFSQSSTTNSVSSSNKSPSGRRTHLSRQNFHRLSSPLLTVSRLKANMLAFATKEGRFVAEPKTFHFNPRSRRRSSRNGRRKHRPDSSQSNDNIQSSSPLFNSPVGSIKSEPCVGLSRQYTTMGYYSEKAPLPGGFKQAYSLVQSEQKTEIVKDDVTTKSDIGNLKSMIAMINKDNASSRNNNKDCPAIVKQSAISKIVESVEQIPESKN